MTPRSVFVTGGRRLRRKRADPSPARAGPPVPPDSLRVVEVSAIRHGP